MQRYYFLSLKREYYIFLGMIRQKSPNREPCMACNNDFLLNFADD